MKTQTKVCLPLLTTLCLLAGSASAAAQEEEPAPWPPADTGGEYLPVPEDYYEPFSVKACGSTVTVASGDVREVEYKSRVKDDGRTKVKYRGDATVDLTRASDGAFIDELDISGPGTQRISADGLSIEDSLKGASIIFPMGDRDAQALAAAGFPEFFYYEGGTLTIEAQLSEDPAAVEPLSVRVTTNTTRQVRDVCEMLDEAGPM
ncbi:hypothetical protein I6N91_08090 [Arthrobacter sp. MSA 4-2]|uniref:hypothetical protein n=1 Tax=Arthrobacter sp. MSA 4-2 TaxID=2794349 RepID=UPI0018E8DC69|nr:hypothetical protein [Arthrobacter sp. MSA 4-2]MBJ2120934.1 hypothetical protein [Arthrobacter sp. MSA 4-2]